MIDPPRVGCRRYLGARLERSDEHVNGRGQKENHEQDQEEIGPEKCSAPAARYAAVAGPADLAGRRFCRCRRHCPASFPRRRTLRKMKNAAIARIGAMNSDTEAPSGMSLPQIAKVNAQVAKTWVWSTGPPLVKILTISKFAKVTISENRAVIWIMLRIIGKLMYHIFWSQLAPSIAAASCSCSGTDLRAARYMIVKNGDPTQTLTRITQKRAQYGLPSQATWGIPRCAKIQLKAL